jgi:hypothetical protein
LNVDGLERNRRKWSAAGRWAYRFSEKVSTIVPDVVVSDARVIQAYYRERYGFESIYIPYGGDLPAPKGLETLERWALPRTVRALCFEARAGEQRRRGVCEPGGTCRADASRRRRGRAVRRGLHRTRQERGGPRVRFPGAIYGEGYRQLLANAAVYIQATEVGGTHPALVEALGYGRIVCYHASPENEEVATGAALPFDVHRPETLAARLTEILADPPAFSVWKEKAAARVRDRYRWEDVADRYEAVLEGKNLIS